ncbi:MAG: phosphonoacetaldehyde reductase [Methanosphaera stadtmanae]|jgi:alcohol dehydrogenase class IV|nr:phosphonoacetaldehyde reductase [Methanosphaera stadtmanae]
MDWVFNVPITFYEYDVDELKNRLDEFSTKSNVVFIGSKRLIESNNLDEILKGFDESLVIFDESLKSLDTHLISDYFKRIIKRPELIIAIGGGTTIDFAKVISALYSFSDNGVISVEEVVDLITSKKYLENTDYIPIIASSTTAGTGSDCTKWATVWDFDNTKKYSVDADYLYPTESWLVPELTLSLPKKLTLSTALDALSHACEAYWSVSTNSIVQVLSTDAISLIVKYLPLVLDDLNNLEYRKKVYMGAFFAGLAFSNTRTTACHSISYPLTLLYGIPHGLAVSLTLSEVLKQNMDYIQNLDLFLDAWGVDSVDEIDVWIENVSGNIQVLKLSEFGIKLDDIDDIIKLTFTGGRMDNNPVVFTQQQVKEILLKCY